MVVTSHELNKSVEVNMHKTMSSCVVGMHSFISLNVISHNRLRIAVITSALLTALFTAAEGDGCGWNGETCVEG